MNLGRAPFSTTLAAYKRPLDLAECVPIWEFARQPKNASNKENEQ
jgi:hypothetical protein